MLLAGWLAGLRLCFLCVDAKQRRQQYAVTLGRWQTALLLLWLLLLLVLLHARLAY